MEILGELLRVFKPDSESIIATAGSGMDLARQYKVFMVRRRKYGRSERQEANGGGSENAEGIGGRENAEVGDFVEPKNSTKSTKKTANSVNIKKFQPDPQLNFYNLYGDEKKHSNKAEDLMGDGEVAIEGFYDDGKMWSRRKTVKVWNGGGFVGLKKVAEHWSPRGSKTGRRIRVKSGWPIGWFSESVVLGSGAAEDGHFVAVVTVFEKKLDESSRERQFWGMEWYRAEKLLTSGTDDGKSKLCSIREIWLPYLQEKAQKRWKF